MRGTCLLLLVLSASAPGLLPADEKPALKESPAVAAARLRQEQIKTVIVKFKRVDHVRKGFMSGLIGQKSVMPSEDVTLESYNEVQIDGKMFRYESGHPRFHSPSRRLLHGKRIGVTNSTLAKTLVTHADPAIRSHGMIDGNPLASEARAVELIPLLMFCRGLDPSLCGIPLSRFNPANANSLIDGVDCKEYRLERGDVVLVCWLDVASGFVIRRMQRQEKGAVIEQTDIEYGPASVANIFPAKWVNSRFLPTGALARTITVTTGTPEINVPLAKNTFDIEFPPNTSYTDRRTGKEYEVREDGSRWERSKNDGSPAEQAPEEGWLVRNRWLLIGICAAASLALYLAHRWRNAGKDEENYSRP